MLSSLIFFAIAVSATPMFKHHGHGQGSSAQTPFKFPLSDGFPNPSPDQLHDIQVRAHGTLPDGALPTSLSDTSKTDFSVIAFNELFEVAFFTSLINNITDNVHGFQLPSSQKGRVLAALTAVQAQEELHAIGANAILKSAGAQPIQPCEYIFPTSDFNSAVTLAFTFTDVVLGTLQDVQNDLATDGDAELVSLLGSIIGQEGEQNGFYRDLENLIPSELPFLTRSAGPLAFSALQAFVVPGSCLSTIDVPTFPLINIVTPDLKLKDQTVSFSVDTGNVTDVSATSVVFINQQNTPVVKPIENVKVADGVTTFDAFFPAADNLNNGLTLVVATKSAGPFANADDVAQAAVFGPGLIEIN